MHDADAPAGRDNEERTARDAFAASIVFAAAAVVVGLFGDDAEWVVVDWAARVPLMVSGVVLTRIGRRAVPLEGWLIAGGGLLFAVWLGLLRLYS